MTNWKLPSRHFAALGGTTVVLAVVAAMVPPAGGSARAQVPAGTPTAPAAPADKPARVEKAIELLKAGNAYPAGCSGFVCTVLGIPQEDANSLLGDNPVSVGKDNNYDKNKLTPGDVVGWKRQGESGHVAIYIGDNTMMLIDVKDLGAKPRKLTGYGQQELFRSSKY